MTEPTVITKWLSKANDLAFCEQVIEQINRNPDRRARIEHHKNGRQCRVVDDSVPIKPEIYTAVDGGYDVITGWEPIV